MGDWFIFFNKKTFEISILELLFWSETIQDTIALIFSESLKMFIIVFSQIDVSK